MGYMRDKKGRRLDSFEVADQSRVLIIERDKPVSVATRAWAPFDSATGLSGVDEKGTGRVQHKMVRTAHGLQVAYTNWYPVSSSETDGPNSITVTASLEYPSSLMFPMTFNGQRTVTIAPGCTVLCDPIGVTLTKGTLFWTRTYVVPAAGGRFPRGGHIATAAPEGNNYGTSGTDLSQPGSGSLSGQNPSTRMYGPAAILGRVTDPGKPVIGIIGDSIANGTSDNDVGYIQRALADNYSFQKVAYPGEGIFGWITGFGVSRARRAALLERCGLTHIVCEYGVNSLGTALAQLKLDYVTLWTHLASFGVPTWQTTLTPQTNSTDNWATVGNQTLIYPSDREPTRLAVNAWLRDGAPLDSANAPQSVGASGAGAKRAGQAGHLLTGILEVADLAESARDSGRWKPGYVADGTHPNATGAAALAAAIDPAAMFGAPSSA